MDKISHAHQVMGPGFKFRPHDFSGSVLKHYNSASIMHLSMPKAHRTQLTILIHFPFHVGDVYDKDNKQQLHINAKNINK